MSITHVASQSGRGTSTGTYVPVTLALTPTSGNILVASVGVGGHPGTIIVTAITQNNVTWQASKSAGTLTGSGGWYMDSEIWMGVVGSSPSRSGTVWLSGTASTYGAVSNIYEYSGVGTSSPLDLTALNSSTGSTHPDTGTTGLTSQASELWVGSTASNAGPQGTATNAFTLYDGVTYTGVSNAFLEKIVSSQGSANCSTTTSASAFWAGCIATFKGSATISQIHRRFLMGVGL